MFSCNIWPRQTWPPLAFGTVVETLGVTFLALSMRWAHLPTIYGMLAFTGVGTGIRLMPGTLHGIAYYRTQISSIVSIMALAISLGGILASTIMLNIFNNKLSSANISLKQGGSVSSFAHIAGLSKEERDYFRQQAQDAIVVAFLGISAFLWLGAIAVLFLGNAFIKQKEDADTHEDGETATESLTKGSYLGSCLQAYRQHA